MRSKYLFYSILLKELFLSPFLYLVEELKKHTPLKRTGKPLKIRKPVNSNTLFVGIHEWGGYPMKREKTLSNGTTFDCGLGSALRWIEEYKGSKETDVTITMSDAAKHQFLDLKSGGYPIVEVSNAGMDFSGYSSLYEKIKTERNSYVVLMNTSVNSVSENDLDSYISYMESNPDVGILGVSYSTKCYQSLIRNNFRPHIQSYFMLTTIEVLNEIVKYNKGVFPGKGIDHKLLLIRKGEIRMSEIGLRLGYSMAVVLEDGSVFKFQNPSITDNTYYNWKNLPHGDMRLSVKHPNKLNLIRK